MHSPFEGTKGFGSISNESAVRRKSGGNIRELLQQEHIAIRALSEYERVAAERGGAQVHIGNRSELRPIPDIRGRTRGR